MGCINSKTRKLKKMSKQSIRAKKGRMAPSRMISSRPQTPTKSMRSDKNNPESLKSYEPSDDEEILMEIKKERQRILRQLDLRMQASDQSASASQSGSQSGSATSCFTEDSSGNSQLTASLAKSECKRMPPQLQEEIKSASSSMQSRQLESLGGEKPMQVNAQLYRSSVPSTQHEPPKEVNPPPHHPLVAKDPLVPDSKPAAGENVSSLDTPQEQSGKLKRPPSLLRAQEMPQIDKPTEAAGPLPRLMSFRKSPTVVLPTTLALFPVAPVLAPFPGGIKSRKSCSSLPHSFSTKPKRSISLTNYTRPPAFGESSPSKGLSFGGCTPNGSLTNLDRPPAFGEASPSSGSKGIGGSLPRQNSLTNRPPFGSNLLHTPLSGPAQPQKAVAPATTLLPPPPFPPTNSSTFPGEASPKH